MSWLCKVTSFVILFRHSFQKGVNSVTCYIMIEMRQVVSYFSFQGNINSERGAAWCIHSSLIYASILWNLFDGSQI